VRCIHGGLLTVACCWRIIAENTNCKHYHEHIGREHEETKTYQILSEIMFHCHSSKLETRPRHVLGQIEHSKGILGVS
jgi:hypothetical protein